MPALASQFTINSALQETRKRLSQIDKNSSLILVEFQLKTISKSLEGKRRYLNKLHRIRLREIAEENFQSSDPEFANLLLQSQDIAENVH